MWTKICCRSLLFLLGHRCAISQKISWLGVSKILSLTRQVSFLRIVFESSFRLHIIFGQVFVGVSRLAIRRHQLRLGLLDLLQRSFFGKPVSLDLQVDGCICEQLQHGVALNRNFTFGLSQHGLVESDGLFEHIGRIGHIFFFLAGGEELSLHF